MGEIVGRAGGTAGVGKLLRQSVDEGRERREQRSDFEARSPAPQTLYYRPAAKPDESLMVSVRLRYGVVKAKAQ